MAQRELPVVTWQGTGPTELICEGALLAELAENLLRGYRRLPWGGVESGGLLFGVREDSQVRICSHYPIECEHHHGPVFELSDNDLARMERLLEKVAPQQQEKGYVLLGWYHSLSSRSLGLSEHDRKFHKRFFTEPRQICMVLRRSKRDPLAIGFFGREGTDHLEALWPAREFPVDNFQISGAGLPAPKPDVLPPTAISLAATLPKQPAESAEVKAETTIEVPPPPAASTEAIEPPAASEAPLVPETVAPAPAATPSVPVVVLPLPVVQIPAISTTVAAPDPEIAAWHDTETTPQNPFEYFGLTRDPFSQTPDSRLFYASPGHREALALLLHGIRRRGGFTALVGQTGVGKSLVLECLIEQLKAEKVQFAYLFNSKVNAEQFLELLANDLDLHSPSPRKSSILIAINEHLVRQCQIGQTTALIIDNAQKLQPEVLEEIELLGNLENRQGKLLQVVFAGQPAFESRLERPELRGLRQRLLSRARLAPLNEEHTASYIVNRLRIAGMPAQQIFSPDILRGIYSHSGGVPRLINAVGAGLLERCMNLGVMAATPQILETVCGALELTAPYSGSNSETSPEAASA